MMKQQNTEADDKHKHKFHSGYAFSQEDRYNWFNIKQGIQDPDN